MERALLSRHKRKHPARHQNKSRLSSCNLNWQKKWCIIRITGGAYPVKKRTWGTLKGCWVPHEIRDALVDFVKKWIGKIGISKTSVLKWINLNSSKYYSWFNRYGKVNEHNGLIPRDHWLRDWEIEKIKKFYRQNPEAGYRRLTYMMLDADIVAVSATTVWRVLSEAGL